MCSSKKGISALQLQRNLGLGSYRTAWHLAHRIRAAMECGPFVDKLKGPVQMDETLVGGANLGKGCKHTLDNKITVVSIVSEAGPKRSVVLAGNTNGEAVQKVASEHLEPGSTVATDGNPAYKGLKRDYDLHMVQQCGKRGGMCER